MKHFLILLTAIMLSPVVADAQDDLYFTPKKESDTEKSARKNARPRRQESTYWVGSRRGVDEYNRRPGCPPRRPGTFRSSYQAIADSVVADSALADVITFEPGDGTIPDSMAIDTAMMVPMPPECGGPRCGGEDCCPGDGFYGEEEPYDDPGDCYFSRRLGLYYGYPGYYRPWFYGHYYYPSAYWYYDPWYDPWYYGYAGWYYPWYHGYGWGGWYSPWYGHYAGTGWHHSGHTGTLGRYDRHNGYDNERPGMTGTAETTRRIATGSGRTRTNGTSTFGSRRSGTRSSATYGNSSGSSRSSASQSRSGASFGSSRSGSMGSRGGGGFGGGSRGGGGGRGGRR